MYNDYAFGLVDTANKKDGMASKKKSKKNE